MVIWSDGQSFGRSINHSIYLVFSLYTCLFTYLPTNLYTPDLLAYRPTHLVCPSVFLYVYQYACICLLVCLSVCLFVCSSSGQSQEVSTVCSGSVFTLKVALSRSVEMLFDHRLIWLLLVFPLRQFGWGSAE